MKWMFVFTCFLILLQNEAAAQPGKRKSGKVSEIKKSTSPLYRLQSDTAHAAFAGRPATEFAISDPTLRLLNERAQGSNEAISSSGIVGMPKTAYGFANGHLRLSTSGATSSGTQTGSGSVGTGSSLGSIGSTGPGMGMNGKNPNAGWSMWGNTRGLYFIPKDSLVKRKPKE